MAQSRPTEPGEEWVRSRPFMVSALVAHLPWNSTLYRACNMNSVHVWFSDVSLCQAVRNNGLPWHFTIQASSLTSAMINTVNTLSTPYGEDGWYLFDEPSPSILPGIASAANWFKSNRPNSLIYINVCGYDPSYIDNVIQTVGPDALMYDFYVFNSNSGVPWTYDSYSDYHFYALMGYRSKAQQYNIPLLIWKQTYSAPAGATYYAREPSESEMRMDVYSGLAAGCKGISYFLWDAFQTANPDLITSLILSGDVPTSMYYAAQAMNPEVSNLGKVLRYLNSTDVRYVPGRHGSWPYTTNRIPNSMSIWVYGAGGNSLITNVAVDSGQIGNAKDGLIGLFTDDTGRQYFMLSNQYCGPTLSASSASLNFTVTFDATVNQISRLNRSTGQQETMNLTNHELHLNLPGGTGDLFCMNTGGFDLSAPTGSISINSGAQYAISASAPLNLSASDDKGVTEMKFSNDNLAWSNWEAYGTNKVWTLTSGDGTKKVYVRYKDAVGTISPLYSDTIILDTTAPTGSISINSGAAATNSTDVILTLSAADTGSGVSQMRFSNGVTWSDWEPYAASKSWTLASGDGTRYVYVQCKDAAGNMTTLIDSIIVDTVLPSVPGAPTDAGAYTASTSVTFNWQASTDSGSGTAGYNCQIGTIPDGNNIFDGYVVNTTKTVTSSVGNACYCRVQAKDNAGNLSAWTLSSDGIVIAEHPGIDIGTAKALNEMKSVGLAAKAVTAVFSDSLSVEESNRSSGIIVKPIGGIPAGLAIGNLVDVGGWLNTDSDYRRWINATMSVVSGNLYINPVGMAAKYIGGSDWRYGVDPFRGQSGVTDGAGLNNIGLLVRTWGKVSFKDAGSFKMSDGSGDEVKVVVAGGALVPDVDKYVAVTGISSCYVEGGRICRLILVRKIGDIDTFD
ncbi:MAG: hypothetical protein M1133_06570 [Armatimonadetes bacterium]|nr:hypothetical protein [Armatimonadota bacterium]